MTCGWNPAASLLFRPDHGVKLVLVTVKRQSRSYTQFLENAFRLPVNSGFPLADTERYLHNSTAKELFGLRSAA